MANSRQSPGLEPRVNLIFCFCILQVPAREKRKGLFWQQEPTEKSPVDNDPDLERGGWEIIRVRDYKDLLHFLSFSLTSGAIGFERTRCDKVWWGTWGQFRDARLWKTTAGTRNQTAGMFIIVQEPGLLGRREKWRLGPLSPYLDPGLKGRKTDRDHEHKALLLHRVQGLTRYSLARGRKEVIDSYIGRSVHGKKKKSKYAHNAQWKINHLSTSSLVSPLSERLCYQILYLSNNILYIC